MNESDDFRIHPEAQGEDVKERPQPADDPADGIEPSPKQGDLLDMMSRTISKLEKDGTTRGDLKILNRTLKELRYAFKVFQPYRRRRKVTVFGSARTAPEKPSYQQAVEFSREMARHGWMTITGAGGGIMEPVDVVEHDEVCGSVVKRVVGRSIDAFECLVDESAFLRVVIDIVVADDVVPGDAQQRNGSIERLHHL